MKNFTHHPWSKWYASYHSGAPSFSLLSFTGSAQLAAKNLNAANGQVYWLLSSITPYDYNPALNTEVSIDHLPARVLANGVMVLPICRVCSEMVPPVNINEGHHHDLSWNGKSGDLPRY